MDDNVANRFLEVEVDFAQIYERLRELERTVRRLEGVVDDNVVTVDALIADVRALERQR